MTTTESIEATTSDRPNGVRRLMAADLPGFNRHEREHLSMLFRRLAWLERAVTTGATNQFLHGERDAMVWSMTRALGVEVMALCLTALDMQIADWKPPVPAGGQLGGRR
jgi:hypothetical protein